MKSLVYGIGIVFGCLLISQAVAATERDVESTYRAHLLPGGGLPNSMVNMGVPDLPYDTLSNLKAHLTM